MDEKKIVENWWKKFGGANSYVKGPWNDREVSARLENFATRNLARGQTRKHGWIVE